jgi:hypothetical protein
LAHISEGAGYAVKTTVTVEKRVSTNWGVTSQQAISVKNEAPSLKITRFRAELHEFSKLISKLVHGGALMQTLPFLTGKIHFQISLRDQRHRQGWGEDARKA